MARPMPVFPLVGSMMTAPGLSSPCFSASFIMLRQMRSLTLPPGFRDSIFAMTVAFASFDKLFRRTSGVLPMVSKMSLAILVV